MRNKEEINIRIFDLTNRIQEHMKILAQDDDDFPLFIIAYLDFGVILGKTNRMTKESLISVFNHIINENYEK